MSKFVTKPREVEAVQFLGTNHEDCMEWLANIGVRASWATPYTDPNHEEFHISILEGAPKRDMVVNTGDWIIRDVNGTVYPYPNYYFQHLYSVKE